MDTVRGRAARWAALWSILALQEKEDDLEVVKVIPERFVEQNADVPVPIVTEVEVIPEEHISERTQIVDVPVPLDQSGEHVRRDSADTVHRQGYCRAYCDTATGPSASNCAEDGGSTADAVHRQICAAGDQPGDQTCRDSTDQVHQQGYRRACCDTATGPSASNCCEDSGSPEDAVHRQFCGRPCDHAATGPSDSNCGEDGGSLPRVVHRQIYGRACAHAATGPSDSNCGEDGGSLPRAVHRQMYGRACAHAARGPSDSNCVEDGGSLACAVHACGDAATGPSDTDGFKDCESPEPVLPFQEEIDETTLVEFAEMMKADNKALLERIFQ